MCPVAYRSRRQITFSGTVKDPSGRGAHEGRLLPLLRRSGQAQRQDLIGVPAVEVDRINARLRVKRIRKLFLAESRKRKAEAGAAV